MWSSRQTNFNDAVVIYTLYKDDTLLSYRQVLQGWREQSSFRQFFIALLAQARFDAYFWETPPLTRDSLDQSFEFALIQSKQLEGIVCDAEAFAEYFQAGEPVASFASLGRDAWLLAPANTLSNRLVDCAHLAAFSRTAALVQQEILWQRVAAAIEGQMSDNPLWVSTSGLGVYWLHVRLDSRPKYYTHSAYR